ncbi:hypothetical protein J5U23_00549 [Saccharolobus shibatae B12]|uniref:Uncharacterized protein n=1 Tax=Saccharolobus shibatae (strain ATCC 51178 / DSM 5389 / JCM 8931 / NBRC 15437 / B12) TaxID=523848 RepID=A0A8F5BLU0_SACSH|nr:hypothetical protein J5U23_00549 [Saccharolobus shibatae B12]
MFPQPWRVLLSLANKTYIGFPTSMKLNGCGFGVIPLKGQRRMNGAMPRDFGEVQGLRIDMKYYEIL